MARKGKVVPEVDFTQPADAAEVKDTANAVDSTAPLVDKKEMECQGLRNENQELKAKVFALMELEERDRAYLEAARSANVKLAGRIQEVEKEMRELRAAQMRA